MRRTPTLLLATVFAALMMVAGPKCAGMPGPATCCCESGAERGMSPAAACCALECSKRTGNELPSAGESTSPDPLSYVVPAVGALQLSNVSSSEVVSVALKSQMSSVTHQNPPAVFLQKSTFLI